jgi:hypothetical protein
MNLSCATVPRACTTFYVVYVTRETRAEMAYVSRGPGDHVVQVIIGVGQEVAMDSLKFRPGPPCSTYFYALWAGHP